ncbi:MAG: PrsW family intramembrane metalloprotease [Spirochaetaceae bacterium]|jgi:RsiW-degrading membrane proteinase PrsW (M82 family)|nr:PrsW family intramembrane metalloprotease [Spirochaetaceae bacterium]
MNSVTILLFLLFISFFPAALAFFWLRGRRSALSLPFALFFLASGVLSLVLALVLQTFITAETPEAGARLTLISLFRVPLSEESARFLVISAFFALAELLFRDFSLFEERAAGAGLLSGLAFAALETAVFAASEKGIVLIRALSAAPLHGACGIRCAAAAFRFRAAPLSALLRFLSAAALHTFYNFMLPRGGISAVFAILLAISALCSSARAIKRA